MNAGTVAALYPMSLSPSSFKHGLSHCFCAKSWGPANRLSPRLACKHEGYLPVCVNQPHICSLRYLAIPWQPLIEPCDRHREALQGSSVEVRVRQDHGQIVFSSNPSPRRARHAYLPRWHFNMLLDDQRHQAYQQAIERVSIDIHAYSTLMHAHAEGPTSTTCRCLCAVSRQCLLHGEDGPCPDEEIQI